MIEEKRTLRHTWHFRSSASKLEWLEHFSHFVHLSLKCHNFNAHCWNKAATDKPECNQVTDHKT